MKVAITTIYVLNCLFLLMVVLLQAGRGGGLSFTGGGGSATVFGNRGASTFLSKLTVGSAALFMGLSMLMASMSSQRSAVEEGVFLPEDGGGALTDPSGAGGAVPGSTDPGDGAIPEGAPVGEAPASGIPAAVPPIEAAPAGGAPDPIQVVPSEPAADPAEGAPAGEAAPTEGDE